MAEPEKPRDKYSRMNAPRGLNVPLGRLTSPLLRKRGAIFGDIMQRWPEIVGPLLSPDTQPERLIYPGEAASGATLEVAVSGAQALELQHLAPLVVERINGYFGYRAVAGLRLKQMPIRRRETPAPPIRQPRPLDGKAAERLEELLSGVEDKKLRQALETLGRSLLAQR
ncbi:DUF721 domain-containing protein [Ferrovibrio sp.]|uniref:DUF721 domain-containing protein n=1 Tax=Ferrovibrio sp. TaxID=1917215 RepID=UPI0035B10616